MDDFSEVVIEVDGDVIEGTPEEKMEQITKFWAEKGMSKEEIQEGFKTMYEMALNAKSDEDPV